MKTSFGSRSVPANTVSMDVALSLRLPARTFKGFPHVHSLTEVLPSAPWRHTHTHTHTRTVQVVLWRLGGEPVAKRAGSIGCHGGDLEAVLAALLQTCGDKTQLWTRDTVV